MAITGLLMGIFAIAHMAGHLIMFAGQKAYNDYAHTLQSMGVLKWVVRGGLLFLLLAHFLSAFSLTAQNRDARPNQYVRFKPIRTSVSARYMLATGLAMFVFLTLHIFHFTVKLVPNPYFSPEMNVGGIPDVYNAFVFSFLNPIFLAIYLLAMLFLCMHLGHGLSSAFQSLGWKHPKYDPLIARLGPWLAVVLFLGFCAPPIAVVAGVIPLV